ncbi:MAG: SGNH/GDSL hydrolase family protein [Gammaproteobacteria bacterium]|nr:SGNH/GDSL hydrolase family protein [Gammaproteobacteria bacterium]
MRSITRGLVDFFLVVFLIALVAQIWTGGYSIELGPFTLKSHSLLNVLGGLFLLAMIRVLITYGWRNFSLVCVSLLFGFACAEAVLRVLDTPLSKPNLTQIHRASDIYGWELIPGAAGVGKEGEVIQVNSAGFRDREWTQAKQADTKRIAVVGDSFTFGMAVNLDDSYVKQLQGFLNDEASNIEVLNFGVIGYGMWQYQVLLEREILKYKPDLIVVGFFLDDILVSTPPYATDKTWKGKNPFEDTIPDEFNGSYSWNLIRNMDGLLQMKYRYNKKGHEYLRGIEDRKRYIGSDSEYYKLQVGAMNSDVYKSFRRSFKKFLDLTTAHGIPLIAAYIPDASQIHESERQHINEFFKGVAGEFNVPLVDVTSMFEQAPDPRALYLFPLDAHTSPEGHRYIATALADEIKQRQLLAR